MKLKRIRWKDGVGEIEDELVAQIVPVGKLYFILLMEFPIHRRTTHQTEAGAKRAARRKLLIHLRRSRRLYEA